MLYEWLRGPRTEDEVETVRAFFETDRVATFGERDARTAAALFRQVKRPRSRQADLAIAACAIEQGASLWTLNAGDFDDVPGLRLYQPVDELSRPNWMARERDIARPSPTAASFAPRHCVVGAVSPGQPGHAALVVPHRARIQVELGPGADELGLAASDP